MSEDISTEKAAATTVEPRQTAQTSKLQRLVPIALLIAGLIAFFAFDLDRFVSLEALKTHREFLQGWVAEQGVLAWLIFGAIYVVAVALSTPSGRASPS